jgi:hypothetical protein
VNSLSVSLTVCPERLAFKCLTASAVDDFLASLRLLPNLRSLALSTHSLLFDTTSLTLLPPWLTGEGYCSNGHGNFLILIHIRRTVSSRLSSGNALNKSYLTALVACLGVELSDLFFFFVLLLLQ